ncbi:thymidylate synthase [Actinomyces sp. MRS3W]|uniref:thymidylate synthase n=1 Tax=Actinomyces sp. MRS3W TaxID=2800796 RepID=UPI0028FD087B|nr:thymidylate synthase [Actinomyces sp. MRS3W]MDU0349727.1 thymidylate synthase [Actinomyces sp. MRS3W]
MTGTDKYSRHPNLAQLNLTPPPGVNVDYEELLAEVLLHGVPKGDRTGTGTRSVFARQLRYDLTAGFPRITTKFVAMKSVKGELLWFLRGDMNARWLQERGITIWDEWAGADGELGPIYGSQWRSWPARDGGAIDQIAGLIETLRRDPDSRRMLVSAWNVSDLDRMALAPCHAFFQCYVADGRLSLQVYQRSADLFLGVPFNIASYALLTHMLAQQAELEVGELVWTGGDCHIYNNHLDQVREQLSRVPAAFPFPRLRLDRAESIDAYTMDDMDASAGYQHHPAIKAPVAV